MDFEEYLGQTIILVSPAGLTCRLKATSKNLCRVRDEVGKILIPT